MSKKKMPGCIPVLLGPNIIEEFAALEKVFKWAIIRYKMNLESVNDK